jgi:hypothetical protein
MKKPVIDGLFLWRVASKAAIDWQKRQLLVGMDAAYN